MRRYVHIADSLLKDQETNDKLYKIRPILEMVRKNCAKIEQEPVQSIDEQIIPAKTKRSCIRQYNPKKPCKWGFKMFVRAGQSGIMYDFFLYSGANSTGGTCCTSEDVVLRLVQELPKNCNYKLCFDNWFCSLRLCLRLRNLGILTTATVRSNRIAKCRLDSDKDLKKTGRGAFSYKTDTNSGIVVVKWFDNKCVHLTSTYCAPGADEKVKRWEQKTKQHIMVDCPNVVKEYNAATGGVDLADMPISLYRTPFKAKRWYLRILVHCIDICKVNAWLLYHRHANQLHIPKNRQMQLAEFSSKIAHAVMRKMKPVDRPIGRPSKRKSTNPPKGETRRRKVVNPTPQGNCRYDGIGHWPQREKKKNKC